MKKNLVMSFLISFFIIFVVVTPSMFIDTNIPSIQPQNSTGFPSLRISELTHEHINISNSDFEIVVGWIIEPPTVGVYNGVLIEINKFSNGGTTINPVTNVQNNLSVVISKGGISTQAQSLTPSDETPGSYYVPIIPTQEGVYIAHISGNLGTVTVDETVQLDEVQPASAIALPITQDSSVSALSDQISSLNMQISSLNSELGLATILIVISLIAAVIALVLGYLNFRNSKK